MRHVGGGEHFRRAAGRDLVAQRAGRAVFRLHRDAAHGERIGDLGQRVAQRAGGMQQDGRHRDAGASGLRATTRSCVFPIAASSIDRISKYLPHTLVT